jgi:hypothetical protein
VFITDSQSWEVVGGGGGTGETDATAVSGGARPQTAETIKTFGERCPDVTVNNIQEKTDYMVILDHEGGKGALRHQSGRFCTRQRRFHREQVHAFPGRIGSGRL